MSNRVVIVGGGLAGIAAAVALAERGFSVTLLESRPRWGGRASSFTDQATGETIDNCQHVSLGCCTNFAHFCKTVGIDGFFRRESKINFVGLDGRQSPFQASPLPAPLHLAPAFARLKFLSWRDKWHLAWGLRALARANPAPTGEENFLHWLQRHNQTPAAIDRFWHVVLVSALSESLDRIDVGHARKVFVDSFLRNRTGWEVWLPTAPLSQLYGDPLTAWFKRHNVDARLQSGVKRILFNQPPAPNPSLQLELRTGDLLETDHVILALPWHLVLSLLPDDIASHPFFAGIPKLESAPISSVHLWFDRPITDLPHATFVSRLSQWLFNRSAIQQPAPPTSSSPQPPAPSPSSFYYQIVISASRDVTAQTQDQTLQIVLAELTAAFPATRDAKLLHSRLVTEHKSVVSMLPGVEQFRPTQTTPIPNLYLAGDWTQTGWPSTMEGAVRSGYLAVESVLRTLGNRDRVLCDDLPTARLSRVLFGV